MKKILISGYYGFNNSGDDAILRLIIGNLRAKLTDVEITVFSQNPEDTASRHQVRAVPRMQPLAILKEIARCDLLISGGGSLLQDATSQRSILYYLGIMGLAKGMGKKVFVYSQGIGPINNPKNRTRTAKLLRKVDGIVVRDRRSKELLREIGVNNQEIYVTADPVIRSQRPDLDKGREILRQEGCPKEEGKLLVGWSMRERSGQESLCREEEKAIRWLQEEWNAQVVLLPLHPREDTKVALRMQEELDGSVGCLKERYRSRELLSLVGNLDVLVGLRLHSLIYAAVMGVPMLGISYDPKIDAFLHSLGTTPVADVSGFDLETFQTRFSALMADRETFTRQVEDKVVELQNGLDINEELICALLENK